MKRIALALIALLTLGTCSRGPKSTYDNVILITLDTTRFDALGAYGDKKIQTPVLDQFAFTGHLFENCYSHAPITLPSHSSILSGRIPTQHGVRNNISYTFDKHQRKLSEMLKEHGFATGAFISSIILDSKFGLDGGFDIYEDKIHHYTDHPTKNEIVTRRGGETISLAMDWISNTKGRFFSWIHLYDAHWPYTPPLPFRQAYADDPYLGEIAYMDHQIGRLVDNLRKSGRYERTLIVVTADHGESFMEHGEQTHGFFCYASTTHVPLILNQPLYGAPGQKFGHMVQSIDLAPSILEALGLPTEPGLDGISLASTKKRTVYAEAMIPHEDFYLAPVHVLRDSKYSYYYSSQKELYDLTKDPQERHNLIDVAPDLAKSYEERMQAVLKAAVQSGTAAQLDQESIDQLRSLGYIADGGAYISREADPYRYNSPKQSIKTYRELQYLRQFEDNFPFKMIEGLRKLIEQDRRQVILYRDLGRLSAFAGNEAESLDNLKKAALLKPDDPRLHTFYGLGLHRFGQLDKSIEEFKLALQLDPNNGTASYNLGLAEMGLKRVDAAIAAFEKAVACNAKDVPALNNLAYIQLKFKNDPQKAWTYILQAEAINDKNPLVKENKALIQAALAGAPSKPP